MEEEAVRWNIKVSKETDLTLRTFLGARGMKKGDLSKFIEDAVRWRVFQRTVEDIKARNAGADPDEIQRIVDEAVGEVRAERRARELRKIPRNNNISRRGAEAQRQQGK
jgi:hypothetical protein